MKFKINKIFVGACLLSSVCLINQAQAAGTLSGTTISNQATLAFSVGGVSQTAAVSNNVSFVVDKKVNLSLVEDQGGTPLLVNPGGQDYIYKLKITNLGNSTQDFSLGVQQQANGVAISGLTDNFNMSGCAAYGDIPSGTGVYTVGVSNFGFVDELAPDATRSVFLVCDTPATQLNNDVSIVAINATVRAAGVVGTQGAAVSQTTGANTAGVDVVFADGDSGGFNSDNARNGRINAPAIFLVKAATLTVVKTNTPICDPTNFNNNPKNIPGAYVRYAITISNAAGAGASAALGVMTDAINTNLLFDSDLINPSATSCATPTSAAGRSFRISCTGGTRACVATPIFKTGAAGDDNFDFTTGTVTADFAAALGAEAGYAAGELKAGESITFDFNAVVK